MTVQASQAPGDRGARQMIRRGRQAGDVVFRNLTTAASFGVFVLLGLFVVVLTIFSWPVFEQIGLVQFIFGADWNPPFDQYGALTYVWGTLYTSLIALVLAVPVSIGAALFVVEYAPPWFRTPVSFLVEMLAAIPSIIFGLWALFVMAPVVREWIQVPLKNLLNDVPVLNVFVQGVPIGRDYLMAGIILAIMIIPTIMSISREVLNQVPDAQREGMLGLGATKAEVIFSAVLPYAKAGLFGASILGLARALGETMAVTLVIGGTSRVLSLSVFTPGFTLASGIATQFGEASSGLNFAAIVGLALVLMLVAVVVNGLARLMLYSINRTNAAQLRA